MNKIMAFTGSRGEWGYLRPILDKLKKSGVDVAIVASNMHCDPEFENTENEIIADGFTITERLPMNVSFSSDYKWAYSLGYLANQVASVLEKNRPDILLVAGDRAETMTFVTICYYTNVIIAHVQAGELSGHKDGMARHAIGKLAHIHFASNKDASSRLLRLGEQKFRIIESGAPQIDDLMNAEFVESGNNVIKKLRIPNDTAYAICLLHGSSDEINSYTKCVDAINNALQNQKIMQIWILPNNDTGSEIIKNKIPEIGHKNSRYATNLSRNEYAYLLKQAKFIVGNSSSGILEAPSLQTPTINVGTRQIGRIKAQSVYQIDTPSVQNLTETIQKIMAKKQIDAYFEYGNGTSSELITQCLISLDCKDPKLRNKYIEEQ